MKALLHAALALVLAGLQAALLHHVGGGAFSLCLPAALLVHLALTAELVEGAVAAAAVGYVLDVNGGGTRGLLTSLAVAVFLGLRVIRVGVEVRGLASFGALSGLAAFVLSAGAVALGRLAAPAEVQPSWAVLTRVAVAALLTSLLAPLLLLGLRRLDALLGERRSELAG